MQHHLFTSASHSSLPTAVRYTECSSEFRGVSGTVLTNLAASGSHGLGIYHTAPHASQCTPAKCTHQSSQHCASIFFRGRCAQSLALAGQSLFEQHFFRKLRPIFLVSSVPTTINICIKFARIMTIQIRITLTSPASQFRGYSKCSCHSFCTCCRRPYIAFFSFQRHLPAMWIDFFQWPNKSLHLTLLRAGRQCWHHPV